MQFARRNALATLVAITAFAPLAALAQAKADPAKPAAAAACSAKLKGTDPMKVKFTTSMGAFTIELDKAKAPISAENFAKYVESGHYNGTIFHRVIDGFMIQGGGFTKDMQQKAVQAPIKNEAANGLKNDEYTVAMARTNVVDSATSQFFINVKQNDFLNHQGQAQFGYAVFGKVVDGKDTVDKIKKVATGTTGGHQNVPSTPVVIEKAECV